MNITTTTVSPLRQRMVEDMRMRKFEPKTQSAYLRAVRKLAAFLWPLSSRPHPTPPQPRTCGACRSTWSTRVPRRSR